MSFVFVAQIKFQVEDYLCRHLKFTNTQIENGHFVMFKCGPSKEITFLATKTQIKAKQGLAKENKFNTVLCKCKKLL